MHVRGSNLCSRMKRYSLSVCFANIMFTKRTVRAVGGDWQAPFGAMDVCLCHIWGRTHSGRQVMLIIHIICVA